MKKILALNSGGFDSVVMLHYLKEEYPHTQIDTLFMNWSQPMLQEEWKCARDVADKLGMKFSMVHVDSSHIWDTVDMKEDAYVPMRNFVFIANAVAHAEKFGYDTIALAIIDNGEEASYFDCSEEFINGLNNMLESKGIKIITPFITKSKASLAMYARHFKITQDDFFSCNTPTAEGEPCGKCNDCNMIKNIYEYCVNDLIWEDPSTPNYKERYIQSPIGEMRLLINNKCQFTCKHCFYGFDETLEEDMNVYEFMDVIHQAKQIGINHIHISGKEPLFDDSIFTLTSYMDDLDMTYDIVTNGVNIKKYIENLRQCKGLRKVFLSVDSLTNTQLRNTGKHILDNLGTLQVNGINYQITMDLCKENLPMFEETLQNLSVFGVKEVYVRAVSPLGNAKENGIEELDCNDWAEILDNAVEGKYPVDLTVCLTKKYYWGATEEDIKPYIDLVEDYGTIHLTDKVHLIVEKYCMAYSNQITVTSDGYMLGCGSQVACEKYNEISPGNLKREKLIDVLYKGKTNHVNLYQNLDKIRCFFNN